MSKRKNRRMKTSLEAFDASRNVAEKKDKKTGAMRFTFLNHYLIKKSRGHSRNGNKK